MDAAALAASGINLNLTSSERAAIVEQIEHTGLITYDQFKANPPPLNSLRMILT